MLRKESEPLRALLPGTRSACHDALSTQALRPRLPGTRAACHAEEGVSGQALRVLLSGTASACHDALSTQALRALRLPGMRPEQAPGACRWCSAPSCSPFSRQPWSWCSCAGCWRAPLRRSCPPSSSPLLAPTWPGRPASRAPRPRRACLRRCPFSPAVLLHARLCRCPFSPAVLLHVRSILRKRMQPHLHAGQSSARSSLSGRPRSSPWIPR